MNGVHDMGGMDGFGKVEAEPNEPVFHEEWEGRVVAMVRAMGAQGAFNIDMSRFYRERLPPQVYLASSYYKKWFLGLQDVLVARGYLAADEVMRGSLQTAQAYLALAERGAAAGGQRRAYWQKSRYSNRLFARPGSAAG